MAREDKFTWDDGDFYLEPLNMGVPLMVGDHEYTLGTASHFNEFLNEISKIDHFPNLMTKSFQEGRMRVDKMVRPTVKECSVINILSECLIIEQQEGLSNISLHILDQLIDMCRRAMKQKVHIEINPQ